MCVCVCVCVSTYLSIYLSVRLSVCLSIHPSIHPSIYRYVIIWGFPRGDTRVFHRTQNEAQNFGLPGGVGILLPSTRLLGLQTWDG